MAFMPSPPKPPSPGSHEVAERGYRDPGEARPPAGKGHGVTPTGAARRCSSDERLPGGWPGTEVKSEREGRRGRPSLCLAGVPAMLALRPDVPAGGSDASTTKRTGRCRDRVAGSARSEPGDSLPSPLALAPGRPWEARYGVAVRATTAPEAIPAPLDRRRASSRDVGEPCQPRCRDVLGELPRPCTAHWRRARHRGSRALPGDPGRRAHRGLRRRRPLAALRPPLRTGTPPRSSSRRSWRRAYGAPQPSTARRTAARTARLRRRCPRSSGPTSQASTPPCC